VIIIRILRVYKLYIYSLIDDLKLF